MFISLLELPHSIIKPLCNKQRVFRQFCNDFAFLNDLTSNEKQIKPILHQFGISFSYRMHNWKILFTLKCR